MRLAIIGIMALGLASVAHAHDAGSVLDRAAQLVNQCVAEQTLAELGKGTAPDRFATVLREKCRSQEQRFRTMLTAGLKKERALRPTLLRSINDLLDTLRQQSVADYAELFKQRPSVAPTRSALNAI